MVVLTKLKTFNPKTLQLNPNLNLLKFKKLKHYIIPIYEGRLFVSLFVCHVEIFQTATPLAMPFFIVQNSLYHSKGLDE
jgi:hypothetical protein